MEALRETTIWKGHRSQPNHTYLFDGSRALAYQKFGSGEPVYFKNPLTIDRRGRTFAKADIKLFKAKPKTSLVEVKGSKGNSYWVDPEAKTCTCPGFTFRATCKHVADL